MIIKAITSRIHLKCLIIAHMQKRKPCTVKQYLKP